MIIFICSIIITMSISFCCSLMEAALLSLNPGKLALLTQNHPIAGKICRKFKDNMERPIAVILLLNTAAHTSGAAVAGAEFDQLFGSKYIWLFSQIFTFLMVQYTEILPKTLGIRFCTTVLRITSASLDKISNILNPVVRLIHWINKPFEAKNQNKNSDSETLDELDALAAMAREEEQISATQEKAIQKIPDLAELHVSDLMIPRSKMVCVHLRMSKNQILQIMRQNKYSRYPVILNESQPNEFVGMLEIRRMLFCRDEEWQKFIRPIHFIDTNESQLHIAENIETLDSKILLVRNPEGKVIGMLTIRDLFDELFSDNPEQEEQEKTEEKIHISK